MSTKKFFTVFPSCLFYVVIWTSFVLLTVDIWWNENVHGDDQHDTVDFGDCMVCEVFRGFVWSFLMIDTSLAWRCNTFFLFKSKACRSGLWKKHTIYIKQSRKHEIFKDFSRVYKLVWYLKTQRTINVKGQCYKKLLRQRIRNFYYRTSIARYWNTNHQCNF